MISIIVPIYNTEAYLAECLDSLLCQTVQDLQIILVDDGSTDNSAAIEKEYAAKDCRIEVYQQSHAGQSAARNNGLKHAAGEFIAFVDADDWLDKDYLHTLVSHIDDKDILQVGYRRVTNEGLILEQKTPRHFYQFTSPCMRLYRADYLLRAPRFIEGMIYEDVIFSLHIWSSKPSYRILPYTGYNYRYNESSTTSQPHPAEQQKLYAAIRQANAFWWLKRLTILRLKFHYYLRQ